MLRRNEKALAWNDKERGTFSPRYFPNYRIHCIDHVPWEVPPIRIPIALRNPVRQLLEQQTAAGKYEPSQSAYRSRILLVEKKDKSIRIVHDMQPLNAVTIRDATLPPRIDEFTEGFVGRQIYMCLDLFSGYDARILDESSRDLTTFSSITGLLRLTCMPQGFTNSVAEFQRCTSHVLKGEAPEHADVFIDDIGIKGPRSDYGNETIPENPAIRKFVWEFANTVDRIMARLVEAGITASGKKLILATPMLKIVGSLVSKDGWRLEHGLVSKVLNWPPCRNLTDVRGFLGTATVGRRWIKGFALIAKPLTFLLRGNVDFYWTQETQYAMDALKKLVTTAPVLKVIDIDAAVSATPSVDEDHEGCVILAVDSSVYGAGWVMYQIQGGVKHPLLFGSCTFSETESRYSQPKLELYGVFRAMKTLRAKLYGYTFRLDIDAQFLKQMIENPDLPNAPMTRWVSYLMLFDFITKHVPAERHKAPDGLSRRPPADQDSEDSDPEEELERRIGHIYGTVSPPLHFFPLPSFFRSPTTALDPLAFRHLSTLLMLGIDTALQHYEEYESVRSYVLRQSRHRPPESKHPESWCHPFRHRNPDIHHVPLYAKVSQDYDENATSIFGSESLDNPFRWAPMEPWLHSSLLRVTDDVSYIGNEFMVRSPPVEVTDQYLLGGELVTLTFKQYGRQFYVPPCTPEFASLEMLVALYDGELRGDQERVMRSRLHPLRRSDWRRNYEPHSSATDPRFSAEVATLTTEQNEAQDREYQQLKHYLQHGSLPPGIDNMIAAKLVRKARLFILRDGLLFHKRGDAMPALWLTDRQQQREVLRDAHELAGHRGAAATRKKLERYWWPSMGADVIQYVRSCAQCQLRSRTRPKEPLNVAYPQTILRKIHLDTVHMPKGSGGYKYILHAHDDLSGWTEARAVRTCDSKVWARFLFEEVLARYSCVPLFIVDGGPEFKGITAELFVQYHCPVIVSSPYHPEGNGAVERAHRTFVDALFKTCEHKPRRWPKYMHATLLAIRTTASRTTGMTPHFMLYGLEPIFPFDFKHPTWYALEWTDVQNTADLIALRAKQITYRDDMLDTAQERLYNSRVKAGEDYARRHARSLRIEPLKPGMLVLRHETWLDNQLGNKDANRWTGPYIVKKQYPSGAYQIAELDGTILRDAVAANRLKIFYHRTETAKSSPSLKFHPLLQSDTMPVAALHPLRLQPILARVQPSPPISALSSFTLHSHDQSPSFNRDVLLHTDIDELQRLSVFTSPRY